MNKGFIYIISNQDQAQMALYSVLSLRLNGGQLSKLPIMMYQIHRYYYEDFFNEAGVVINLVPMTGIMSEVKQSRLTKALMMHYQPFDKYILLDPRAFITKDFSQFLNRIDNNIVGVEEYFPSILEYAKGIYGDNARQILIDIYGVDYNAKATFPPLYNLNILGLTNNVSKEISRQLLAFYKDAFENPLYKGDEQFALNSILFKIGISCLKMNHIFNYCQTWYNYDSVLQEEAKVIDHFIPWKLNNDIKRGVQEYLESVQK